MKSRILLTIAAILSIGLAQAAAHDEPVQIDLATRRSRENKEFALGVAIGMFGPAAAEKVGIPFGEILTEAAIRGGIAETAVRSFSLMLCTVCTSGATMPITDTDRDTNVLECLMNLGISASLAGGSCFLQLQLVDNHIHPITRSMQKGITFGYYLRTMKKVLGTEQRETTDTVYFSLCVLSSLALAGKAAYDFLHR